MDNETIKNFVYYDETSASCLRWAVNRKKARKDEVAGTPRTDGYWRIGVNHTRYLVHRIVYFLHHNVWPQQVDHIDGNPSNNRIENLRAATCENNLHNMKMRNSNTSGVKGVNWHKASGKWIARIRVKGERIHVGLFDALSSAALAVQTVRNNLHKEFANHG